MREEIGAMKKHYKYYIVGQYIVRVFAWKIRTGRMATYHETTEQLWDRAQKYGYTALALD